MSNNGFSTVLALALIATILTVFTLASSVVSRNKQKITIESQIDNLHIPANLQSKQCISGDGVDSEASCRFTYSDSGRDVEEALKNNGYISKYGDQTEAGGTTSATFSGGNPALSIQLQIYNGSTTLDATRGN
jgi:hypothetical protein